jgi:hypothetical protein
MKKNIFLILIFSILLSTSASAYMINGKYASLISCDWGWSAVRGESGYTGTYKVMGEIWTVYFGSSYCKY